MQPGPTGNSVDQIPAANCPHRHTQAEFLEICLNHLPASKWCLSRARRLLDVMFALLALTILAAPMLMLALLVRLTSKGSVLFSQSRVGAGGSSFVLYKFRSMIDQGEESQGPWLTTADDRRLTPAGKFMRRFKLDELPQLYNILRGDMSMVGPRPKLQQYDGLRITPYRPGFTGAATLAFRREEEMLRGMDAAEIDRYYAARIKPAKARIDACYMCRATPLSDLKILACTLLICSIPGYGETSIASKQPETTENWSGE